MSSARSGAEGIQVKVVDRDGNPVEGASVGSVISGVREESVGDDDIDEPIRAAYSQPGEDTFTQSDGIASLPATETWDIVSERDADNLNGPDESVSKYLPGSVDPLSGEAIVILFALYDGDAHEWFGVQRYSLRQAETSTSRDNPVVVPLLHKRLYGPTETSTKLLATTSTPEYDAADKYDVPYGEVTVWQTVPDAEYGSNNNSHRITIEVTAALQLPLLKYDGSGTNAQQEDKVIPTIDALDALSQDRVAGAIRANGPFKGLNGDSLALRGGSFLSVDLPENPNIEIIRKSAEESGGGNRDRARNFRPRLVNPTRYKDQALITATIFGFRGRDGIFPIPVPIYATFPGSFDEQSLVKESQESGAPSAAAILKVVEKALTKASEAIDTSGSGRRAPGQFKAGVASSPLSTAADSLSLISGIQSVFAEPKLNLNTDLGSAGPRDPNSNDRLKAVIPPGEKPSPVGVFSVPFSFRSGESSERLTARGLLLAAIQNPTFELLNQDDRDNLSPAARIRKEIRVDAQTNPIQTGGEPQ